MTFKSRKCPSPHHKIIYTGAVVVQLPSLLNWALDGNEWLLYPIKSTLNIWLGGPQSHSQRFEDKKISYPCWDLNLISVFPKTVNEKPHNIYIFMHSVHTDFSVRKYSLHTLRSSHGNCTKKKILRHSVQLELLSSVLETASAYIIRFRYDEQDTCLLYLYTQAQTEIDSNKGTHTY